MEQDLIPGLPNLLVLNYLLPRIPWYTRPLMKALSKAWRNALQIPGDFGALTRRVLREEGFVVVHQLSTDEANEYFKRTKRQRLLPQPHAMSIYDEDTGRWRQLPPIPAARPLRILHDCGVACVDSRLYVMGGWDPTTGAVSAEIYMLDLGSGLWNWEKRCSMRTAKAFFNCKSLEGKIYVVGGSSSQNPTGEEPLPEIYDVEADTWDLLPGMALSRSFQCQRLAVADDQILAYGFCASERGEIVKFCKLYDPVARKWTDWDGDLASCSHVVAGDHDLREGVLYKLDTNSKKWTPLGGKVCTETYCWEGGTKVVNKASTCAHSLLVVNEGRSKPHVYATLCEGEARRLSIWRGHVDYRRSRVAWRKIEPPGNLAMCSEMCYLRN